MPNRKQDEFKKKIIPLNGRLRTKPNPITIDTDFYQMYNMRYTDDYPQGVLGQTKINTSALDNPKIRSIFQLRKEQPAESHIVVQAFDSNGSNPKIYTNTTAVPSAGNFVGGATETVLYTEDTSAGVGRFSEAPDGALVYCNGKETCLWGGSEFRVASFIRYDLDDNSKKWDVTAQVNDTSSEQYVTTSKYVDSTVEANTVLLAHFNNNVDDDGVTDHTITNTNCTFTTSSKFGSHALLMNASGEYLSIPDHADFDLSGGTFTIDFWIGLSSTTDDEGTIFYQETDDNNYIRAYIAQGLTSLYSIFKFDIYDTGAAVVELESSSHRNNSGQERHIAIVESGNNYYLYVDGSLEDTASTADRAANYTGTVYIGHDVNAVINKDLGIAVSNGAGLDEFRIVNGSAVWTGSSFEPPSSEYGVSGAGSAEFYVGSILPIKGINFDVGTANTSACTPAIYYWDGNSWESVGTVTDGTNSGTGALEQDGEMSWTYTEGNDKPRMIDNQYLYWYKLSLPNIDNACTITYVTVDIPFQPFKDIWDGVHRPILSVLQWDNATQKYVDHTISVFEDYYDSADSGTYANVTDPNLDTSTDYILFSSIERLAGMSFSLVGGKENVTASTPTISYWDGDEWVSVGTINDLTSENGASLAKSGVMTWTPPSYGTEFKRQDLTVKRTPPSSKSTTTRKDVEGGRNKDVVTTTYYDASGKRISGSKYRRLNESVKKSPFINAQYDYSVYWYKLEFNATLSDDIYIYNVGCIPAPTEIGGYSFPVYHDGSIWLMGETSQHKNQIIKLASGTVNVANGSDTVEFRIGTEEETPCGASLNTIIKDDIVPTLIVFKKNQTWAIYGSESISNPILIDKNVGCVAPGSVKNVTVKMDDGNVDVVLFQGHDGIYATNGFSVDKISEDIDDTFEIGTLLGIVSGYEDDSEAFYDENKKEYHILTTGYGYTSHSREHFFDCQRLKWSRIVRGTVAVGSTLQCGACVHSTTGVPYTYGGTDGGFLMRLENGTSFANTASTNALTFYMQTGWFTLEDIATETIIRNIALHSVTKTGTSTDVTVYHLGDLYGSPSTPLMSGLSQDLDSNGYVANVVNRQVDFGPHVYHQISFTATNTSDTPGFEPIYLVILYKDIRLNVR